MDMSAELPDLKRTKGLTNWLVKGQNKFYSDWEEAQEEAVGSLIICPSAIMPLSHHCQQALLPAHSRLILRFSALLLLHMSKRGSDISGRLPA